MGGSCRLSGGESTAVVAATAAAAAADSLEALRNQMIDQMEPVLMEMLMGVSADGATAGAGGEGAAVAAHYPRDPLLTTRKAVALLVRTSVDAFLCNDLYTATRQVCPPRRPPPRPPPLRTTLQQPHPPRTHSLPSVASPSQDTQPADQHPSLPHTGVCFHILACALTCRRVLSHAGVCSHMRTPLLHTSPHLDTWMCRMSMADALWCTWLLRLGRLALSRFEGRVGGRGAWPDNVDRCLPSDGGNGHTRLVPPRLLSLLGCCYFSPFFAPLLLLLLSLLLCCCCRRQCLPRGGSWPETRGCGCGTGGAVRL